MTTKDTDNKERKANAVMIYTVQGNYGQRTMVRLPDGRDRSLTAWEDLTSEDTREEAMARMREYAANEPGVPLRVVAEHLENHKVRRTKQTDYKG